MWARRCRRRPPGALCGCPRPGVNPNLRERSSCSRSSNQPDKALDGRSLPRFSLDPGITRQYLRSRAWLAGLASDLGGALLMVAAFSLAPVRGATMIIAATPCSALSAA